MRLVLRQKIKGEIIVTLSHYYILRNVGFCTPAIKGAILFLNDDHFNVKCFNT